MTLKLTKIGWITFLFLVFYPLILVPLIIEFINTESYINAVLISLVILLAPAIIFKKYGICEIK